MAELCGWWKTDFFFFSNDKLNREKEHGFVFCFLLKKQKKKPSLWYMKLCALGSSFLSDKFVLLWIFSISDISLIKVG